MRSLQNAFKGENFIKNSDSSGQISSINHIHLTFQKQIKYIFGSLQNAFKRENFLRNWNSSSQISSIRHILLTFQKQVSTLTIVATGFKREWFLKNWDSSGWISAIRHIHLIFFVTLKFSQNKMKNITIMKMAKQKLWRFKIKIKAIGNIFETINSWGPCEPREWLLRARDAPGLYWPVAATY